MSGAPSPGHGEVPWVSASAVGQATYCPYQLYLARGGAPPDEAAGRALAEGRRTHAAWNVEQRRAADTGRLPSLARSLLPIALAIAALALVALGLRALFPGFFGA